MQTFGLHSLSTASTCLTVTSFQVKLKWQSFDCLTADDFYIVLLVSSIVTYCKLL